MNRERTIRVLRIAVTGTCLVLSLLLVGLWIRSYDTVDSISGSLSRDREFYVDSVLGRFVVGSSLIPKPVPRPLDISSVDLDVISPGSLNPDRGVFGFRFDTNQINWTAVIPYWFLVSVCVATAAVPWIRWRFSLRTLLIATTLTAVALGLLVWARGN